MWDSMLFKSVAYILSFSLALFNSRGPAMLNIVIAQILS